MRFKRRILSLFVTLGWLLFAAPAMAATTFDVTTTDDDVGAAGCTAGSTDCSLREAILAANGTAGADTIRIPAGTYLIALTPASEPNAAAGDFDVTDDVTIERLGAGIVTIDAEGTDRVFDIAAATTELTVSDVTLTGGAAPLDSTDASGAGGAIRTAGQVTLNRVVLEDNHAPGNDFIGGGGGAVKVLGGGSLAATDSRFVDNDGGRGGAINAASREETTGGVTTFMPASVELERSVVRSNQTTSLTAGNGGGIWLFGSLTTRNSEISGNTAGLGGGMYVIGGGSGSSVTLRSTTVSGNEARSSNPSAAGGLTLLGKVTALLEDSTIARNRAASQPVQTVAAGVNLHYGSQANNHNTQATIRRSILAEGRRLDGTTTGPSCGIDPLVTVTSDHSLADDGTCALDDPTDKPSAAPALGALGENGGPTRTHALGGSSPAIDAGGTGCPSTDQRGTGFPRPLGNACDIGAFESPGSAAPDADSDGFPNSSDNCPDIANPDQANVDGDGPGDACDDDDDGDGHVDAADNCPLAANQAQENTDGLPDGGDACDGDDDQDGIADAGDNCRTTANPDQANGDRDDFGDACEPSVEGTVELDGQLVAGANVTLCVGGAICRRTQTDAQGRYAFVAADPGPAVLAATAGISAVPESVDVTITGNGLRREFELSTIKGPPEGTRITPVRAFGDGGVPNISWGVPFDIEQRACIDAKVTYSLLQGSAVVKRGSLVRAPGDATLFRATVNPLKGQAHGFATVKIEVDNCANFGAAPISFGLYIDPSGNVRDLKGRPIFGATVRLYRSDSLDGPFEFVPDGSLIMSPGNRRNADKTDANGHFGWDVIPGFYTVQAEKAGCRVPQGGRNTAQFAETRVLTIPPPVLDLDIRLDCPYRPKLLLGALPRGTFSPTKRGVLPYRITSRSPFKISGTLKVLRGTRKIGVRRFKLAANRSSNVSVKLNRAIRARVAKGGKVRVTVAVSAKGPARSKASARRAITLRARR